VFVFAKEYFHPFNPTPLKYKPLIMVGPSGVGKNTLREKILAKYGGLFEHKISYTTRPSKSIEKKKENYYFITREEFMKRVEKQEFVEYVEVNGHLYGTTYAELERIKQKGKIPLIEVDVKGAIKVNERAIEGNFLFVYPPSFEELRNRLGQRIETEEEFKLRIQNALNEIELANNSVLFTNRLVNDDLEQATDQFYTLIEALYFQELKTLHEKQQ
jgi:guanylate kinase